MIVTFTTTGGRETAQSFHLSLAYIPFAAMAGVKTEGCVSSAVGILGTPAEEGPILKLTRSWSYMNFQSVVVGKRLARFLSGHFKDKLT